MEMRTVWVGSGSVRELAEGCAAGSGLVPEGGLSRCRVWKLSGPPKTQETGSTPTTLGTPRLSGTGQMHLTAALPLL